MKLTLPGVILSERPYNSKKGVPMHQYTVSVEGLVFDIQSDKNLIQHVSNIADDDIHPGKLYFELAVFSSKPYLKFLDFSRD